MRERRVPDEFEGVKKSQSSLQACGRNFGFYSKISWFYVGSDVT